MNFPRCHSSCYREVVCWWITSGELLCTPRTKRVRSIIPACPGCHLRSPPTFSNYRCVASDSNKSHSKTSYFLRKKNTKCPEFHLVAVDVIPNLRVSPLSQYTISAFCDSRDLVSYWLILPSLVFLSCCIYPSHLAFGHCCSKLWRDLWLTTMNTGSVTSVSSIPTVSTLCRCLCWHSEPSSSTTLCPDQHPPPRPLV